MKYFLEDIWEVVKWILIILACATGSVILRKYIVFLINNINF